LVQATYAIAPEWAAAARFGYIHTTYVGTPRLDDAWTGGATITYSVWLNFDKASTEGGSGAFTAGVVIHQMYDGTYVISHVIRGRWGALQRETIIRRIAEADAKLFKNLEVGIEQEPGSAGKESAEATVRNLAGHRVFVDRVSGSKEVRAQPFIAQVQNNNVSLVAGNWIREFLDECEAWPAATHKDQVDAAVGAFNRLVSTSGYDTTYAAFQPGFVDYDRR
jgi:predicted phage terminase large subunit-like protein